MDEAKRRELEELRKQIDPEVLQRVAKAMDAGNAGAAGGGAAPSSGGGGGGGGGGLRSGGGKGGSLSDLKRRMAKREKEWDRWEQEQLKQGSEKKTKAETPQSNLAEYFVLFDQNMLQSRQLVTYLRRMDFTRFTQAGDPQRFLEAYVRMMNNPEIRQPAIVTTPSSEPVVKALINSEQVVKIRQQLPNLGLTAIFVFYETDKELGLLQNVDPRYVINTRHDPSFSKKRVSQILELLHTIKR